jgi:hypothetical protein
MTIPLERLRDFPHTVPGPGHISLAVARHQASSWPSSEVNAYAEHRAALLHMLVDESEVAVDSWGETDAAYPREVVEIVLGLGPTVIATFGAILAALISRPRKAEPVLPMGPKPPPDTDVTLPGIAVLRPDGARLSITYRDGLKPGRDQQPADGLPGRRPTRRNVT